MNWVDLGLVLFVAGCAASGLKHGFSREGLGFAAVLAALACAAWLSPESLAGFLLVFAMALCALGIAAHLVGKWLKGLDLEWLDRPLGGVFAAANGVLLGVLAMLAMMTFAPPAPRQYVAASFFAPYAAGAACTAVEAAPDELKYGIRRSYEEWRKAMPHRWRKPRPDLRPHEI